MPRPASNPPATKPHFATDCTASLRRHQSADQRQQQGTYGYVLRHEPLARQWHARGQGFKSPQLHPRSEAMFGVDRPQIGRLRQQMGSNPQPERYDSCSGWLRTGPRLALEAEGGSVPSAAYQAWFAQRQGRVDQLLLAHHTMGGSGRGRHWRRSRLTGRSPFGWRESSRATPRAA